MTHEEFNEESIIASRKFLCVLFSPSRMDGMSLCLWDSSIAWFILCSSMEDVISKVQYILGVGYKALIDCSSDGLITYIQRV